MTITEVQVLLVARFSGDIPIVPVYEGLNEEEGYGLVDVLHLPVVFLAETGFYHPQEGIIKMLINV